MRYLKEEISVVHAHLAERNKTNQEGSKDIEPGDKEQKRIDLHLVSLDTGQVSQSNVKLLWKLHSG